MVTTFKKTSSSDYQHIDTFMFILNVHDCISILNEHIPVQFLQ